MGLNDNVF